MTLDLEERPVTLEEDLIKISDELEDLVLSFLKDITSVSLVDAVQCQNLCLDIVNCSNRIKERLIECNPQLPTQP